ncbi:hypothetical protein DYH09_18270 [bacterium CPR1]|nr:hypothetical protein [bacterium CPR1]
MLLLSCGTGGGARSSPDPSTLEVLETGPRLTGNYERVGSLSFLAPTGQGVMDVTPGSVSARERNAILSRASREEIQASHAEESHLFQLTTHQQEGSPQLVYALDRLQGSSAPFVAYRPEAFQVRSLHNGVTFPLPSLEMGGHLVRYRWTLPAGEQTALVAVQPVNLSQFSSADLFVVPSSEPVETVLELNVGLEGDRFRITGQVLAAGQFLMSINADGGPAILDAQGNITNRAQLPLFPTFKYPLSGMFALSVELDGATLVDEAYLQRGLTWEQDWPVIETSDFSPIAFSNRLIWDTGDATVDDATARWRATFPGDTFPRWSTQPVQPYQAGASASFTYDPDSLQLSARQERPESIRLVPEGLIEEYASSQAFRQEAQAREGQVIYPYSVEGQAISFSTPPVLRATAHGGGMVPARVRQLCLENVRFEPEVAEGQEPTTFRADVVSFLFEEPQIRWSLEIQDAGRVFAQTQWQDFDETFELSVPWDRLDASGETVAPGSYTGSLSVEVREKSRVDRNGNPIILPAEATADFLVPGAGGRVQITSFTANPITFAPSPPPLVTFRAQAQATDFEEEPQLTWRLTVTSPAGNPIFETSRVGPDFEAEWQTADLAEGLHPTLGASALRPLRSRST